MDDIDCAWPQEQALRILKNGRRLRRRDLVAQARQGILNLGLEPASHLSVITRILRRDRIARLDPSCRLPRFAVCYRGKAMACCWRRSAGRRLKVANEECP